MKAAPFVLALLLVLPRAAFTDVPVLDLPLTINDGAGSSKELRFGFDQNATDGYDAAFGEAVLPPPGFPGTFDARFIGTDIGIPLTDGSWKDYRQGTVAGGGTRIHELQYQVGSGTVINIAWDLPAGVEGRLQDIIVGSLIDVTMIESGNYTVTNPSGFPRLKMTMTYEPGLAVQLSSFAAKVLSQSSVLLEWSTLSEINNYGFYVQRRTVTDRDFVELPNTFVPGHGTTNVPQLYSFTDNTVTLGTWLYCLRQVDLDGSAHFTEPVQVSVLTRVKETAPNAFVLHQNYPNPFNPSTTIKYELPRASHVRLSVFSTLGREVATLVDEAQEPGYRSVQFDGSHLSSAVYLYRLEAGDFVATKRLLLLR